MPVDLHTHTTASDGTLSPVELVEEASRIGLTALAVTDHDTLSGVESARARASATRVEVVSGVELSLTWTPGTMHLVVLFLEPGRGPLQDRLADLRIARQDRNARIVEILRELGIDLLLEDVHAEARGEAVGRPHIAAALVHKGVVPNLASAFEQFLGRGAPAHVHRVRLRPEEAIDLALKSGAVPILAHPHTLGLDRAEEIGPVLTRLAGAGLIGLESHYSAYEREQREELAATARGFGLVPTGGSDFHGDYKPEIALGHGRGDLSVPPEVLEELRGHRAKVRR